LVLPQFDLTGSALIRVTMQTYASHRRFNPLYHFIAFPIFAANLVVTGIHVFRAPGATTGWAFVVAFGMLAMLGVGRVQALMVQDRLIRLEERLRLQALAPELAGQVEKLNKRQVAALRFASDAELPELARRVFAGEFASGGDIKRAVTTWRPDHMRV
jgi:hypothetical protein